MALDKLVDSEQLNAALTNIANKIRSKTGKSSELSFPNDFESEIESIQTGGGGDTPVASPALTLIDWEGTILKEYSSDDALALAALPAPNTLSTYSRVDHELLSFQEWNWSLADIKTWINNHSGENLLVGAIYTTTDNQDHNYWKSSRFENTVTAIYMQKRATNIIYGYDFNSYGLLTSINIPMIGGEEATSIGTYAFQYCYSLTSINIPDSVTSIGTYAFQNCTLLKSVNISDGVTSIGSYAFGGDKLLFDVIIHGKPNLLNTNAFSNGHENRLFYVPRENLSWFESATNWSSLYSRVVAIEDYIEYLESIGINVDEYK